MKRMICGIRIVLSTTLRLQLGASLGVALSCRGEVGNRLIGRRLGADMILPFFKNVITPHELGFDSNRHALQQGSRKPPQKRSRTDQDFRTRRHLERNYFPILQEMRERLGHGSRLLSAESQESPNTEEAKTMRRKTAWKLLRSPLHLTVIIWLAPCDCKRRSVTISVTN